MTKFPRVEAYRARIRQRDFTPLTDDELRAMVQADRSARHNAAIEGLAMGREDSAFSDMLLAERVPAALASELMLHFVKDGLAG
ncbi:hypothetical protein KY084_05290 [Stakelama sp. CBK3Z-3]|uniref:Extradiol ring-cleavage dioxygenase LigAB LigA subunit domain-containing protein n=1 Tax=Stakelama flava TaxID=2860338 RepID=A0ABS6XLI3_9SPHN|nr:hypothetical protein [Stakelama flava]MBW4330243.1 hypothetical protein [Stakelama flava]MBW4330285.1 hypothetical protein [Stakelama flava]